MNDIGWKRHSAALVANYTAAPTLDLQFKAKHLKVKTSNTMTISFNGKDDHAVVLAADGLVHFEDVFKGKVWLKGTGTGEVTAWDGN